jgi:hypothetical protein
MIIYVFKKHETFLKTMKIYEFFLIIWGKLSKLEPEPELEPELEPDKNGPDPQHWSQSIRLRYREKYQTVLDYFFRYYS